MSQMLPPYAMPERVSRYDFLEPMPAYITRLQEWGSQHWSEVQSLKARVAQLEAGVEAERQRIIGILNRPNPLLISALHYTADETAAWFGEAFLAEYLKP